MRLEARFISMRRVCGVSGRAGLARRGAFFRALLARLMRRRHDDADFGRHPARHRAVDEFARAIRAFDPARRHLLYQAIVAGTVALVKVSEDALR